MGDQGLGIDAGGLLLADREVHDLGCPCTFASLLMVETTAIFLPTNPNFLMSATIVFQSERPNGGPLLSNNLRSHEDASLRRMMGFY